MSGDSQGGERGKRAGHRRNIRIGNRRTSVKLEPEMWDALAEICQRTDKDVNQICTEIHRASGEFENGDADTNANFTSQLRVYILDYYRAAARSAIPTRAATNP